MIRSRTIPKLTVSTARGSDPDVIESIDDCTEMYADNVIPMFPEIDTPCDAAPSGQCEYNGELPEPELYRCLHCKRLTGA